MNILQILNRWIMCNWPFEFTNLKIFCFKVCVLFSDCLYTVVDGLWFLYSQLSARL